MSCPCFQVILAGIIYAEKSCSAFRIVLKDSIATSSMEVSGWRVVRDWRARFGLIKRRTRGEFK